MGVHGLWRLIEPSGKPVPLESLENKILAVDISIWLHQAIKGFQDSRGAPLPNAHLLGIYHRVCKLLYFRIKPVFVFDGGVPALKKQTIGKRNQQKIKNLNQANDIQTKLIKTLLKQTAVSQVIADKSTSPANIKTKHENERTKEDLFKLPELPTTEKQLDSTLDSSYSSDDDYESNNSSPTKQWDLHTIDVKSEHFRSLPADVRHEILTEMKETRKQSSWGRIHEMPTDHDEFTNFQINRLLKRYSVQVSLEEAEKEMGGHSLSLGELEALLNEEGIVTGSQTGGRIASNENARYLLIKDVQKAMQKAKENEEKEKLKTISEETSSNINCESTENNDLTTDKEYQRDLEAAIQLSLQDLPSTSKETEKTSSYSYVENFKDVDFESESDEEQTTSRMKSAKSYMMEYSGLTPNEITKILNGNTQKTMISKKCIQETHKTETNEVSYNNDNIKKNCTDEIHHTAEKQNTENKINLISDGFEPNSENKAQYISSDSEDSEFIEVHNEKEDKHKENTKPTFEIVINPNEKLQDDIFSDIFTKVKTENIKMTTTKTITESTTLLTEVKEINKPDEVQNKSIENEIELNDDIVKEIGINKEIAEEIEINEEVKVNKEVVKQVEKIIVEPVKPRLTEEELNVMKSNLVIEQQQLLTERNTKERMAGNITDQMYQEAQELLELFGVPYIIAPMEAEAQCAFLNEIDLTDGTITDDSDIWLFGGKTVYKNFFNHNKHVFEFKSESIEHYFKLSREQLILLALLVGSDYTIGLQGIGPVTALEILAAFPPAKHNNITILTQDELISGLSEFRRWLSDGRSVGIGRTALRSKLRNVTITEGFPSLQVIQAYLQPKVETCRDKFTWSKPDIVGLIDFAKEKFGWTKLKSEEILKPVMRKLDDKNIQKTIKDYFATKHKLNADIDDHKLSKRVKTAVKKMGNAANSLIDEEKNKKTTKKNTSRTTKVANSKLKNENNNGAPSKRKVSSKKEKNIKEYIPQKEQDKLDALKKKLKAIEVFRKSKDGPGYAKKREKINRPLKEEAELSESSSSD